MLDSCWCDLVKSTSELDWLELAKSVIKILLGEWAKLSFVTKSAIMMLLVQKSTIMMLLGEWAKLSVGTRICWNNVVGLGGQVKHWYENSP